VISMLTVFLCCLVLMMAFAFDSTTVKHLIFAALNFGVVVRLC